VPDFNGIDRVPMGFLPSLEQEIDAGTGGTPCVPGNQ